MRLEEIRSTETGETLKLVIRRDAPLRLCGAFGGIRLSFKGCRLVSALRSGLRNYSCSLRAFLRFRLRAKAAFTRRFSPGFR